MPTRKHPKPGHETRKLPADDLDCNPGIGASRGTTAAGASPSELEGDNTFQGDVASDVTPWGSLNPEQRRRTNK